MTQLFYNELYIKYLYTNSRNWLEWFGNGNGEKQ